MFNLKELLGGKKKEIEIIASPSQVDNICFFSCSEKILDGKYQCNSKEDAQDSLLLTNLFALNWVLEVAVEQNKIIVKKMNNEAWPPYAKAVGETLRSLLHTSQPLFSKKFLAKLPSSECHSSPAAFVNPDVLKTDLAKKVLEILESSVAPSLAAHGGSVSLVNIKEGTVYLNFSGGCQGCSQVSSTVKDGIEQVLKQNLPEIKQVVDVTAHNLGTNPWA